MADREPTTAAKVRRPTLREYLRMPNEAPNWVFLMLCIIAIGFGLIVMVEHG